MISNIAFFALSLIPPQQILSSIFARPTKFFSIFARGCRQLVLQIGVYASGVLEKCDLRRDVENRQNLQNSCLLIFYNQSVTIALLVFPRDDMV
jgi:hypothetical protein